MQANLNSNHVSLMPNGFTIPTSKRWPSFIFASANFRFDFAQQHSLPLLQLIEQTKSLSPIPLHIDLYNPQAVNKRINTLKDTLTALQKQLQDLTVAANSQQASRWSDFWQPRNQFLEAWQANTLMPVAKILAKKQADYLQECRFTLLEYTKAAYPYDFSTLQAKNPAIKPLLETIFLLEKGLDKTLLLDDPSILNNIEILKDELESLMSKKTLHTLSAPSKTQWLKVLKANIEDVRLYFEDFDTMTKVHKDDRHLLNKIHNRVCALKNLHDVIENLDTHFDEKKVDDAFKTLYGSDNSPKQEAFIALLVTQAHQDNLYLLYPWIKKHCPRSAEALCKRAQDNITRLLNDATVELPYPEYFINLL